MECGFNWNSAPVLQQRSEFTNVHRTGQGKTEDTSVHKQAGTRPHCKYASKSQPPVSHLCVCVCIMCVLRDNLLLSKVR